MQHLSRAAWELLALLDRARRDPSMSQPAVNHLNAYTELVLCGLVSGRRLTRKGLTVLTASHPISRAGI